MKFDLTHPCGSCPFRSDRRGFLHEERAEEIIAALYDRDGTFPCHKTLDYEQEDEEFGYPPPDTARTQHCAGAMILMERSNHANQLIRIAERLHLYDRRKLDMTAPVFQDPEEFIQHHAESDRYDALQG